ncbi:MAG: hypothetical protein WDN26_20800 [Chitinophagaceae bacterium]
MHSQSGKILGFGARILKSNDRAPKYIIRRRTKFM